MIVDAVSHDETPSQPAPHTNVLSSTYKSLKLLEVLARAGHSCGVSELARMVDSTRGTVHKQLSTLTAAGWVEQGDDGKYHLSLLAANVGHSALLQAGFDQKVQRILEETVRETGECITVGALHGNQTLIVQRAESDQVLNANIRVGTVIPLQAGASSLVLLAFATTSAQRQAWSSQGLALPIETKIDAVREQGWACTDDELLTGVRAVGVPVRDKLKMRTLALTMVAPKERLDVELAKRALRRAQTKIHALSEI